MYDVTYLEIMDGACINYHEKLAPFITYMETLTERPGLEEAEQDIVTLHCYSPPLKRMQTFSIDSKFTQIYKPVNEVLMDGSGV